jgi:membrane protein DedA with SNARE-associated domain
MLSSNLAHALLIFVSTFVLEDIAVLGAALLVVNSMVALPWAAASSFAGIWIGDFGLYVLAWHFGRPVFERSWFKRLIGKKIDLTRSEGWFRDHGTAAIVISRAVPGTRLPTYLAAGLLKVPLLRFLTITGAACIIWVAVLFGFSYHVGMMVISEFAMFRSEAAKLAAYSGYGEITSRHVEECVSKSLEYNVFEIHGLLIKKQTGKAKQLLEDILKSERPEGLIGLIARKIRDMYKVKALLDRGDGPEEITSILKMKNFVAEMAIKECRQYTQQELRKALKVLADIDYGIKCGEKDASLALPEALFEIYKL